MNKIIIPFRLQSKRFPNKVLTEFLGKPLIQHSLEIAKAIDGDIILTSPSEDYEEIKGLLDSHIDYTFIPTNINCTCATDRVLEISRQLNSPKFRYNSYDPLSYARYIVLPVDEPLINPTEVRRVSKLFTGGAATLYCDFFKLEDCVSPFSAKVLLNRQDEILSMSRNVIPVSKDGTVDVSKCKKNIGVFFFDQLFLDELYLNEGVITILDKVEGLEQLRWLELGFKCKAFKVEHFGFGIDSPKQLGLLEERYNANS